MGLTLVTGPARAGKSRLIDDRVAQCASEGRACVLAVPTMADVRRMESRLSASTPVGVETVTLRRWAESMWSLHGDGRRLVDAATRQALVERLFHAEDPPGLRRLATRAVQVAGPGVQDRGAGELARIAGIVEEYARLLDAWGMVEPDAAVRLLAHTPWELGGSLILTHFLKMSDSEIALIKGLSRRNEVVVSLHWQADAPAYAALTPVVEALEDGAQHRVVMAAEAPVGELEALADLLCLPSPGLRTEGAVRLGEATGFDGEVDLVAHLVSEEVERGIAPERIIVAFGELASREDALRLALARRGITAEMDVARPLSATPLGRVLCAVLDLALGTGGPDQAITLLTSPYSGVSQQVAGEWDTKWRGSRALTGHAVRSALPRIDTTVARTMSLAAACVAGNVTPQSAESFQKLASHLIEVALKRTATRGSVSDSRVHRALGGLVSRMAAVPGSPFTGTDVRAGMDEESVGGTSGEPPGSVQVTEISRIGSRRFDVVIVAGLTAGEYPVSDGEDAAHRVLTDLAPASLVRRSPDLRPDAERLLVFQHVITRARERVAFVRQDLSNDASPLRPSSLWDEVVDVYRARTDDPIEFPPGAPHVMRRTMGDLIDVAPAFACDRVAARAGAVRVGGSTPTIKRGSPLSASAVEALSGAREILSASRIEAYLSCPYGWFYRYVLRPQEIDDIHDARETGVWAHSLLSDYYAKAMHVLFDKRVTEQNLGEALALFDDVASEAAASWLIDDIDQEIDAARALRMCRSVVCDDATHLRAFRPVFTEMTFGADGRFRFAGHGFQGRIDRIDVSDDACFVTDYKTAKSVPGASALIRRGKVQAVLYALAAEHVTGKPCAGSVYRSLPGRVARGVWRPALMDADALCDVKDALGSADFAQLVEETEGLVSSAVEGMRAGVIPQTPSNDVCAYCPAESCTSRGGVS